MSIASNVIDENTKLGTARTILREKLTAWNIVYNNDDTLFQLLKSTVFGPQPKLTFIYGNKIVQHMHPL